MTYLHTGTYRFHACFAIYIYAQPLVYSSGVSLLYLLHQLYALLEPQSRFGDKVLGI